MREDNYYGYYNAAGAPYGIGFGAAPIDAAWILSHGDLPTEYFDRLPEEVQEQVNQRAMERQFHSEEEMRRYVKRLLLRA